MFYFMLYPFCLLRGNCKCISWKWVETRPQLNQRIKKGPAVLVVAILNFGFRGGNTNLIEELFCSFYKTYFLRPILYCTLRCSHFPPKFLHCMCQLLALIQFKCLAMSSVIKTNGKCWWMQTHGNFFLNFMGHGSKKPPINRISSGWSTWEGGGIKNWNPSQYFFSKVSSRYVFSCVICFRGIYFILISTVHALFLTCLLVSIYGT